jgi:hypothetical protein
MVRCSIEQSIGLTFLSVPSDDEGVVFFFAAFLIRSSIPTPTPSGSLAVPKVLQGK